MRNTADVTGGKPIAVLLQSISCVSAINPLVAFYEIHGGKREVLFFYFVPDTTRDRIAVINKVVCIAYRTISLFVQTSIQPIKCIGYTIKTQGVRIIVYLC
jgi:hypothetical protein